MNEITEKQGYAHNNAPGESVQIFAEAIKLEYAVVIEFVFEQKLPSFTLWNLRLRQQHYQRWSYDDLVFTQLNTP